MTRKLLASVALAAAAAGLAAPAAAVDKTVAPHIAPLFIIREAAAADAQARAVDYNQLLTVQTVDAAPGVRLLEPHKAPVGLTLVPANAPLVAAARVGGGVVYCYTPPSSIWVAEGQRWCFDDADRDGRFEAVYATFQERGSSRIAYSGGLSVMRGKPLRYQPMSEAPTAPEVLALRYVGPTDGEIVDGHVTRGVVEFELMMGPDRVHLSAIATIRARTDALGRGRGRGPLGIEIAIEEARADGRARVQVTATAPVGEARL